MKDQKRRLEGGEWEPQISLKYLAVVPNSTPKRHTTKVYRIMSHWVWKEPIEVPYITRNPTQRTELETKHERARNGPNSTKQGTLDCPLQYLWQSAIVPWTVHSSKIWKPNQEKIFCTLLKNERRTVWDQGADRPQFKSAKNEVEKQVLDEAKTRVADCLRVNPVLSGSHETTQNISSENRL